MRINTGQKQAPQVFLEISQNSQETPVPESLFLINLQAATLLK